MPDDVLLNRIRGEFLEMRRCRAPYRSATRVNRPRDRAHNRGAMAIVMSTSTQILPWSTLYSSSN
jgi:hypothetical protein